MKLTLLLGLLLAMFKMAAPLMAGDSPVTVSIAIPYAHNERQLEAYNTNQYFHVIIANTSDQPIRIWQEWCSWGYFGLSFELTDNNGKTWTAQKKPRGWTKNYPDFWVVPAGENLVLDVHFTNAEIWEGFPEPHGAPRHTPCAPFSSFSPTTSPSNLASGPAGRFRKRNNMSSIGRQVGTRANNPQ